MAGLIGRVFGVEGLVRPENRQGPLPTTREAYRDVLRIAIPSVLEMVLVSLVSSIDTMMVGTLGPEAIAAVGLTGQPRMLILCVFFALNIGVTAVVARRRGQERQAKANETLRNALVIIAGLSLVMMAVAIGLATPLMRLAGAQDDTVQMASTYFVIVNSVLPLNAMTLCINAAQRGVGNTRITMVVNILSNAVNIVLNWLLINGNLGFPKLGVTGAAIATAVGFSVGFCFSVYSVTSRGSVGRFLHISLRDSWRLKRDTLAAIGKVGGNAMAEQIALRIGFFVYARLVAELGTMAFAAHNIVMQFTNISFNFGDGIGVAGTSLVGQMLGRERGDLAVMYGKVSQRIAFACALCMSGLILLLRYPLVGLFTTDQHVLTMAAQAMLVVAAFQLPQTTSVVISGCLRGAGDTRYVAVVMLICVAILRPILAYTGINILHLGLIGAWLGSLIDMTIRAITVYLRFHKGKWVNIKV